MRSQNAPNTVLKAAHKAPDNVLLSQEAAYYSQKIVCLHYVHPSVEMLVPLPLMTIMAHNFQICH